MASGHVGGVSCVRFTADDLHVVSIGKRDRSVFIWRLQCRHDGKISAFTLKEP